MNNNWHKKEKPLLGLTGLGGGVDGLGVVGAAAKSKYIDEIFNTYLYLGNESDRTVVNGVDNSKGGMVWTKSRTNNSGGGGGNGTMYDTVRGATYYVRSNLQNAQGDDYRTLSAFNNNGFDLGIDSTSNQNGWDYSSWNFQIREKFFDVVQYTGDGNTSQNISHKLKSVPGCIHIKRLTGSAVNWYTYHKYLGATKYLSLNQGNHAITSSAFWNDTTPTSSVFTVGNDAGVNESGATYIAYLFAHNDGDGDFGEDEDKDIIACGGYSGNGTSDTTIDLGWEPQYVMIKKATDSGPWHVFDTLRGIFNQDQSRMLNINDTDAESDQSYVKINHPNLESLGFRVSNASEVNQSGHEYIYVAIRAADGYVAKPPEAGTDSFAMDTGNSNSYIPNFDSSSANFPVAFMLTKDVDTTSSWYTSTRQMDADYVKSDTNDNKTGDENVKWDSNQGWGDSGAGGSITWGTDYQSWMWKRGKGLDIQVYEGSGLDNRGWKHSLGQDPEMIWIKRTNSSGNAGDWMVGHKDLNDGSGAWGYYLVLNKNQGEYNDSDPFNGYTPNATNFQLNNWNRVNASGSGYMAMLFASVSGISKVGSYAGSSSEVTVTTGFQPRFVIIKRATGIGQWSTFDTTRGWGAGDDYLLEISDSGSQSNNYDAGAPTSTGFTVATGQSAINNNGDRYVYYAHA